ncbi:MAG: pyruvate carboxylase [Rhizobiales bacterium]|nr:pyruvate carboxylase [Hyphomicrobiales bacterium]NRB13863.1 pyruvate carboxylase [Hyphomicrobiales bacterium]
MSIKPFSKLLVANRSEIAIRICRAATELGIKTVAIYSHEDRFALHRFKADESYLVGEGKRPVQAYLDIEDIIRLALESGVDAIHPGYGFLSENPDFVEACEQAGIQFIGPSTDIMKKFGNKISARHVADLAKVPTVPATGPLPDAIEQIAELAEQVGYPLMLKASWGGGGRGMRVIENASELQAQVASGKRESKAAFGNDEVYLEKLIRRARHIEVQILADHYGNVVHLFERECSMQRRNQKVVERAPAPYLSDDEREAICASAHQLMKSAGYENAGTVEFLWDVDDGQFYFIEVNPRVQVEHTVTEEVTGIDIVKAQIRIAQGGRVGQVKETGVPPQAEIKLNGHALQCRLTTEDPLQNFVPDYGRITAYRGATGFGIRLDGGTAFSGAVITPFYDSMLEKVTAWGSTPRETIRRMDRALREFRIRGVSTNLQFLEKLINHPDFATGNYTTRFIDQTPSLFDFPTRKDRATRLLNFMGNVIVNGNDEVKGRPVPNNPPAIKVPKSTRSAVLANGTKNLLETQGAEAVSKWMLAQTNTLITDTTMRDAHQSLFATRMRSKDITSIAPYYAEHLPNLFSLECWGGATFDVAMRFLTECPWRRLNELREAVPNVMLQMLLRGSNGVGYKNYPDNVVKYFVQQAAKEGVDVFRVFDSLNWVENMRVAMDAVVESGKICEAAICYSGDLTNPKEVKYTLDYYVDMAKQLEAAGAHIIAIKDMAGLVKPDAARLLITTLKQEISLPLHFHTHDTSGIAAASVLAAVDAGVDAVDVAFDIMSGLTSQPNLGSIHSALKHTDRPTGLNDDALISINNYWEDVRRHYSGFEAGIKSGASDVYKHEMPGGQYTNLKEQARGLGLEQKWPLVAKMYADVNEMFGNIVKVTPSSKVVGDMALYMMTSELTVEQVQDPDRDIAFPASVIEFFKGDLGQPVGGFPKALQKKVLKGETPLTERPGASLAPVDLVAERKMVEELVDYKISDAELASHLMYPQVFKDYMARRRDYGNISVLPTDVFFYGLESGREVSVEMERGKTLIIRYLALGDVDEDGMRKVFFELNGQPRTVRLEDHERIGEVHKTLKADANNSGHVGAPMPGLVANFAVNKGDIVAKGDRLFIMEAMKMETAVYAEVDGVVNDIILPAGKRVEAHDLVLTIDVAS